MARFNPQAFIAGMQSLLTPQQQAQQQVQQMRMQQMDKARENEALVNARQLQNEQLGIQREEAKRAGERFQLDKDAAERQKAIDDRNKKLFDIGLDEKRTEALGFLRKPIDEAKKNYETKLAIYNAALANPNVVNRADWNKISSELTAAATAYTGAYNDATRTLPYVSPQFKLDASALGEAPTTISPISRDDAIRKNIKPKPISTGAPPPPPPAGVQTGAVEPSVDPALVEKPTQPVPVASLMSQVPQDAGVSPLTLLAPASLGVGVSAPPVGATKKTLPVGKNAKVAPKPVAPVPVPPRQRLFEPMPDVYLDPKEIEIVNNLTTGYKTFTQSYFGVPPSDEKFAEKWNAFVNDPTVMSRYLAGVDRELKYAYGEDVAKKILADFEQNILDSVGKRALVPTALRDTLLTTEKKGLEVDAAKAEAKFLSDYRPKQLAEMDARIAKHNAAIAKGATKDEAWTYSDRNSATRLAENFGSDLTKTIRQYMTETKRKIDEFRQTDPERWAELVKDPKSGVGKMQQGYNQAVALIGRINAHKQSLRQSIENPNRFYKLLQQNVITGVTHDELKGLVTTTPLFTDEPGGRPQLQTPQGDVIDDFDTNSGNP